MLLKYLSNFCRSLEMSLINGRVELKPKWKKYCLLTVNGNHNANANSNNIIFNIKDTKVYVLLSLYQQETTKNYQNLPKDLKDQFTGMNIKQKVRLKIQQMNIDIFSKEI